MKWRLMQKSNAIEWKSHYLRACINMTTLRETTSRNDDDDNGLSVELEVGQRQMCSSQRDLPQANGTANFGNLSANDEI